jgi:GNAT superfamily N-acetyltransferase
VIVDIKKLTLQDAPAAYTLSTQAGWNHLVVDWERSMTLSPDTCLGAFIDDVLAATCTVAKYGTLGWIGTFLVDQNHQRKGVGTTLFEALLQAGRKAGIERFGLDSSDLGRPIYRKYGFAEDEGIERWLGRNRPVEGSLPADELRKEDWDSLLEFDREAINVNRQAQLRLLAAEEGATVRLLREEGNVIAFGFSRPGRLVGSIGPVIAEDASSAERIIDSLLADRDRIDGDRGVAIDLLDNDKSKEIMSQKAFTRLRRNIRMFVPLEGAAVFTGPKVFASTGLGMG